MDPCFSQKISFVTKFSSTQEVFCRFVVSCASYLVFNCTIVLLRLGNGGYMKREHSQQTPTVTKEFLCGIPTESNQNLLFSE